MAVRAGDLSPTVLRGPRWRRIFRDVYVPSNVEVDHLVLCRGAALVLPPSAALAGHSAALLWGVDVVRRGSPVEVVVPPEARFGPVKGLRIRCEPLPPEDTTVRGGLPVTTPSRTAWDLARQPDLVEAIVALDALGRAKLVTYAELRSRLDKAHGRKGSRRARQAIGLMDPRAESHPESRLRVRLILAGVPAPVPQYEVRVDGRLAGRVDLAWPEYKVAVEYDGVWHASAEQLELDRRRLNRLIGAGWLVLHVTADRMRDDFAGVVYEIQQALASRPTTRIFRENAGLAIS